MGPTDATQALLERALAGSALRQSVLADNLANANTPGFRRQDVNFEGALAQAMDAGDSQPQLDSVQFSPQVDQKAQARADGNTVDVDTEMAAISENALTYQTLAEVARARMKMIETALGGH